jgi:hypothetical protein
MFLAPHTCFRHFCAERESFISALLTQRSDAEAQVAAGALAACD